MATFEFMITAPATMSALVAVEAETIEEAHKIALKREFYENPVNANFKLDEGNTIKGVYLPDASDYEIIGDTPTP